ncbi:MAG: hypothetical protein RL701_7002, partial [Pseudomonadota bacterium]
MGLRFAVLFGLSVLCAFNTWLLAPRAQAQFHRVTDPVATPASTLVLQEDAAAIDVNPAALGLMRSWNLAYQHAQVDERAGWLGQGDAISVSTPLLLGLSAGASVQSVRPRALATHVGTASSDRALVALALAYAPTKRIALGITGHTVSSGNALLDGLSTVDVGFSWHAVDWLGFSLVGRDLLASRRGFGTDGLDLRASLIAGWQVRPLGTSDLVFDFDIGFNGGNRAAGRAGLGVGVPYFGYASSVVEVERFGRSDHVYRVLAELTTTFERLTLGGGVVAGDNY